MARPEASSTVPETDPLTCAVAIGTRNTIEAASIAAIAAEIGRARQLIVMPEFYRKAKLFTTSGGLTRRRPTGTSLVRALPPHPAPPSVGGPSQEAPRRSGARAALSGSLYPPRGHLQSPADRHARWQGHVSLERLPPWQQAAQNDAGGGGVHPPLPAACASQGSGAHPLLRLDGQPLPAAERGTLPHVIGRGCGAGG